MPLIKMHTSTIIKNEKDIMGALSDIVADITGKPKSVVMVTLTNGPIMLGEDTSDAAFLDIRGIGGISKETNSKITQSVCDLLKNELGISSDKVYITFIDIDGTNWGWNNKTFW
jgi:phenylpyruvate tautomerase PptA (4-oxalocrotonate tautomerase family)